MANIITVNRQEIEVSDPPETPFLWVLRDSLHLTGTKYGCDSGLCGACTIHLNGRPVRSCQIRMGEIDGASVETVEGLDGPLADAVLAAWNEADAIQCGYCFSGQVMTAIALLAQTPNPTDSQIDAAMDSVLCPCGAYGRIREAIRRASARLGG